MTKDYNVKEVEDFRGNLNYEQLLARAIDRCLYFRTVDPYGTFFQSVVSLGMSLVDMPGRAIKGDYARFIQEHGYDRYLVYVGSGCKTEVLPVYDAMFQEITRILQKHHMLFRSQMIETNL